MFSLKWCREKDKDNDDISMYEKFWEQTPDTLSISSSLRAILHFVYSLIVTDRVRSLTEQYVVIV